MMLVYTYTLGLLCLILVLELSILEANWHWTNPNDEVFQLAAERGE